MSVCLYSGELRSTPLEDVRLILISIIVSFFSSITGLLDFISSISNSRQQESYLLRIRAFANVLTKIEKTKPKGLFELISS